MITLFLVSCGGGNSQSSAAQSTPEIGQGLPGSSDVHPFLSEASELLLDNWADSGPFDSTKMAAQEAYEGIQADAELNRYNAGRVLTATMKGYPDGFDYPTEDTWYDFTSTHLGLLSDLLTVMQQHLASAKYNINTYHSSVENPVFSYDLDTCSTGRGTAHLAATQFSSLTSSGLDQSQFNGKVAVLIEFDDCTYYDGNSIDGLVKIYSELNSDNLVPLGFSFQDASFTLNDQAFTATGVISKTDYCIDHTAIQANLLIDHSATGAQTLYEDVEWRVDDEEGTLCADMRNYPWNTVNGTLKLSEFGTFQVDTSAPLLLSSNPVAGSSSQKSEDYSKELVIEDFGGVVRFTGVQQSSMTLQMVAPKVSKRGIEELPFILATIDTPETAQKTTFTTSSKAFNEDIFLNFADSDNDGLHDSWETYHSMNPTDPRDASVVKSNSDITPIDAYIDHRSADGSLSYAPSTDLGISVSILSVVDKVNNTMKLEAVVRGQMTDRTYEPYVKLFNLVLEGDAEWNYAEAPIECNESVYPKTITCGYALGFNDERIYGFEIPHIPIIVKREAEIFVTATLDTSAKDKNMMDNIDHFAASFYLVPPVDYKLDVSRNAIGNTVDVRTITAIINQDNDAADSDVVVDIKTSDGVNILDAELLSTGTQALVSRCTIGLLATCKMDRVLSNDELSLVVEYVLTEDTDQYLDWTVATDAFEVEHDNNRERTSISAVSSTSVLQALIDATEEGGTVNLPVGRFAGTIDFEEKSVNITGAPGEVRTILESHNADEPILLNGGEHVTVSNIVFKTSGGLIAKNFDQNLTIENSLITPLESQTHKLETLVDSKSYRLLNNTIKGFGADEEDICESLVHQHEEQSYDQMGIYLERNLFLNNNCNQLILTNTHVFSDVVHTMNNNTFVNSPLLLKVSDVSERFESIRFVNNIFVNINELLDLPEDAFTVRRYSGSTTVLSFYTSRNLLWNSERGAILTGELIAREGVSFGKTDMNEDPMFVNAGVDDFRLAFNSPAIDRGVQPIDYIWADDPSFTEYKQPEESEKIQAIDGSLDGQSIFDIGAFEFNPESAMQ